MKMKTATIVIGFFVLLLVFSCTKKEAEIEEGIIQTEIEKGFLEYWFFPEGTYWVYQLNGWEIYDTVSVIGTYAGYEDDPYAFYQEAGNIYHVYTEHSNKEYIGDYYGSSSMKYKGYYHTICNTWMLDQIYNEFLPIRGNHFFFYYPYSFYSGKRCEEENINFEKHVVRDSFMMSLPAGDFHVVQIDTHTDYDQAENPSDVNPHNHQVTKDIYLSKGVGVVRWVTHRNRGVDWQDWKLVDYYISE